MQLSLWRHHDDAAHLLAEVRQRYRSSPAFARLLHASVSLILNGGEVVLVGKVNARRVLEHVLQKLLEQEQASDILVGATGKWQWLELSSHRYTGKRAWQKISRARAWVHAEDAGTSDLPLTLTRLLGYPGSITREQAARLVHVHGPRHMVLVDERDADSWIDTAHDLDLNDNEHFRNDCGYYDDTGTLQVSRGKPSESWETGYRSRHEAWNADHEHEAAADDRVGGRFYPARMWSRLYCRIDWHGAMRLLEHRDHQAACRRALDDLAQRQALTRRGSVEGEWWRLSAKQREAIWEASVLRAAQLDMDDAEVAACAQVDVPQTDLELLEEQLRDCLGKAPAGLVAAVAHERVAVQRREERMHQQRRGLAALERALA